MWGFSCKGWLQKLFVFSNSPIIGSRSPFWQFRSVSLCFALTVPLWRFAAGTVPLCTAVFQMSSSRWSSKQVGPSTILDPFFSDVARCCQFALYARTHAIYIYIYIYHTMWCCYRFSWKNRIKVKVNQLFLRYTGCDWSRTRVFSRKLLTFETNVLSCLIYRLQFTMPPLHPC